MPDSVFSLFLVKELIPLGAPRRDSVDATPHPGSGSLCLEPSEKTPKLLSSLPKCIPSTKNPELEQRDKPTSAALKASNKRPHQDSILDCKVVMRKLQPNNGNINSRKDGSLNSTVKKDTLRSTTSYNREREISFALSKELNENLRVNATIIFFLIHFYQYSNAGIPKPFSQIELGPLTNWISFILSNSKI